MDLKKLAPWNWFKKEDEEASATPIRVNQAIDDIGSMEPYQPLYHFQRQMERLFATFFRDFGSRAWYPGDTTTMVRSGFLKPSVARHGPSFFRR